MKNLKKISLLFSMLVMFFSASAAQENSENMMKINGSWLAMHEEQDGTMTSTTKWTMTFNSESGDVSIVLSVDANGIDNFFSFSANGKFELNDNQLTMDWNMKSTKLEFNALAALMFGNDKNYIQKQMEDELKSDLAKMKTAVIENLTENSFIYIDEDGIQLDFNRVK